MDLTVAICCFNARDRVAWPLQALACQEGTEGIGWEIIVLDNASTDGTAEEATRIALELGV